MMHRKEITSMLSKNLENLILKKYPLWGSEVRLHDGERLPTNVVYGRADYVAIEPLSTSCSIRSIEAGYVHVFEIKSCLEDFKSGYGLNRVGDVNWLVITADLHEQLIDAHIDTSGWNRLVWGIIDDKFTSSSTKDAYITSRKFPMSQAIWMILMNSDRVCRNRGKGLMILNEENASSSKLDDLEINNTLNVLNYQNSELNLKSLLNKYEISYQEHDRNNSHIFSIDYCENCGDYLSEIEIIGSCIIASKKYLTAEQAISTILNHDIESNVKTCEDISTMHGVFICSECGCRVEEASVSFGGINFCPDCGKLVER